MESSENFAPPPPPPPIKGPIPTKKLDTQIPAEAPACVQNAMMTKDKKPFTYTPGGIDLSQIKSPRMAKRVQKNAMSEGVTGPKVSPLAQPCQNQQPSAPSLCKDIAGMPFQVFPSGPPSAPPMPVKQNQQSQLENGTLKKLPKSVQQNFEPPPMGFRPEIKIPQNPMANLKPTPRPQQNDEFWIEEYKSDKAAEPVLGSAPITTPEQNISNLETELPKHLSLHDKKGQLEQLYIPSANEMNKQQLMHQQSPPWMSSNKYQPSNPTPEWVNSPQGERRIPIQIEGNVTKTPSLKPLTPNLCPQPFYGSNKNNINAAAIVNAFEPSFLNNHMNSPQQGYSSPVQCNPNHFVNQGYHNIEFQHQQPPGANSGVSHIIPIKLEGAVSPITPPVYHRGPVSQSPIVVQSDPRQQTQWSNNIGGAPTQSRSFKVLQKITDAYASDMNETVPQYQQEYLKPMISSPNENINNSMRQIKLNEEDKSFMNRVRNQVDDEQYLHKEENPRYRGSAIPSKAFKLLQNMTNSNELVEVMGPAIYHKQGKAKNETDEDDAPHKPYVPASEQQVFEPKKYTGANIPSRSFKLLQAMTQSETAKYAEYLQQLDQLDSTDANNLSSINNINNNFTHFPLPPIPNFTPYAFQHPYYNVFNKGSQFVPSPPTFDREFIMQLMKNDSVPLFNTPNFNKLEPKEEPKPKLIDDMMNDLDRLKDVELIDLLDDTTKSILDSLKSLQLHYGINIDGLDVDNDIECRARAAELLKSDNKPALYSSLTNILKRDCSNCSILSLNSLNDRLTDDYHEMTEEKANLIRSLSNLLKAESCISATIQSQSRSRLNSFTSEKSNGLQSSDLENKHDRKEKDNEEGSNRQPKTSTPSTSRDESLSKEYQKNLVESFHKTDNQEDEEIDFWACIKNEDDELPPRRPFWNQKQPSSNEEEKFEDSEKNETLSDEDTNILINENQFKKEVDPKDSSISESSDLMMPSEITNDVHISLELPQEKVKFQKKICSSMHENTFDKDIENGKDMSINESFHLPFNSKIKNITNSSSILDNDKTVKEIDHKMNDDYENYPLDLSIEPPEDFQDRLSSTNNGSSYIYPYDNWTPDQYNSMLQVMYHNYYTNPTNPQLLANPIIYHQYIAYHQYMQNLYYQLNRQSEDQNGFEDGNDFSQPNSDVLNNSAHNNNFEEDVQCQLKREEHAKYQAHQNLTELDTSNTEFSNNINHTSTSSNNLVQQSITDMESKISTIESVDNMSHQNIDLIVEDHTELLEEAIVEGKMLIIPSETVTEDASTSLDEDLSTSCTVVTATKIEKLPLQNNVKSEIIVYEIDDNQGITSDCETMGEEEEEIESLQTSEYIEEEQSEGEDPSEECECDDIPPLTYFKHGVNEHLPHQLSVIFEDNEFSERASFRSSSIDSSPDVSQHNKILEENKDTSCMNTKTANISLELHQFDIKEESISDVNFIIHIPPKLASLDTSDHYKSVIEENDSDISVSVSVSLKKTKNSIDQKTDEEEKKSINDSFDVYESLDIEDEQMNEFSKTKEQTKLETQSKNIQELSIETSMDDDQSLLEMSNLDLVRIQPFNRSSSVPPSSNSSDNKTDEAIQRRFQALREQWGQLAEINDSENDTEPTKSSWKISFFDAHHDLFKKQEINSKEVAPERPQSCLTIQPKMFINCLSNQQIDFNGSVNCNFESSEKNWFPKRVTANTENWCPKNRVCQKLPVFTSKQIDKLKHDIQAHEHINTTANNNSSKTENTALTYKTIEVQELASDSESEDEYESEDVEPTTSHASLSESSYNSWKINSSKTLKSETLHSNSSSSTNNQYQSANENTTGDLFVNRAHSCPKQSISNDTSINVRYVSDTLHSNSRPVSCTREMEPKSDNIRYIRASSITRESSLSRQSSQSFGRDVRSPIPFKQESCKLMSNQHQSTKDSSTTWENTWEKYVPPVTNKSPMLDWINAQTLPFSELQTPRQYRSLSVAREFPSENEKEQLLYRPSSCTREMESIRNDKKTSSLYRKLSNHKDNNPYLNVCSFTTHPERPSSCTLELDFEREHKNNSLENQRSIEKEESPKKSDLEYPVVLRRVKRQPRPVSCAGELEKQSYRNSLEGSRLEVLTEQCSLMPTVIEIHHNQPARPTSCTREIESLYANKSYLQQKPRKRAHSVTREIILCTPNSLSTNNEATIEKSRMSVRDRVSAIEDLSIASMTINQVNRGTHGMNHSSVKSSIDESEADDDSGVQSSKYGSEVETDNEGFSELRKMTPYQRANTQTKLYQYLQECVMDKEDEQISLIQALPTKQKKIVHNVSATRRQNPEKIKDAETPQQRRQRLSLPLMHQHSSGIESADSAEASPIRDKLVNELVQSLLLKKDGRQFRNIPLEKLHAAALKILEEEEEPSLAPSTVYSTPAQTPSEFQLDSPCSYEDYHASWQQPTEEKLHEDQNLLHLQNDHLSKMQNTYDYSVFPSKTFKRLHDQVCGGGTNNRRASLPKSTSLNSSSHGNQYGTTSSLSHSHSPSPFGT